MDIFSLFVRPFVPVSMHSTGLTETLAAEITLELFYAKVGHFEVPLVRRDLSERLAALVAALGNLFRPDAIMHTVHVFLIKGQRDESHIRIFLN